MSSTCRSALWGKVLAAVAVLGIGLTSPVWADTMTVTPIGGTPITGVESFNFSFGNAVAVGAANLTDGQTFQLLYQTALTSYNNATGVVNDPRLNAANGYQVTEVASFFEVAHAAGNGQFTFTLAAGQPSNVSIFEQALGASGITYSFASGTGFSSGTQIYSGTISGVDTSFTATAPGTGSGQTTVTASTSSSDSAFFNTQPLISTIFQGALIQPYFAGTAPPSVNGHTVTAADSQFQVSAGVQSFAVPEPASMAMGLMAIAIAPLVTWQVRRRRARA